MRVVKGAAFVYDPRHPFMTGSRQDVPARTVITGGRVRNELDTERINCQSLQQVKQVDDTKERERERKADDGGEGVLETDKTRKLGAET